jgi:hypothetical protein
LKIKVANIAKFPRKGGFPIQVLLKAIFAHGIHASTKNYNQKAIFLAWI